MSADQGPVKQFLLALGTFCALLIGWFVTYVKFTKEKARKVALQSELDKLKAEKEKRSSLVNKVL